MQGVADLADGKVRGVEQGLGLDKDALADYAAGAFAGGGLDLAGEILRADASAAGVELDAPLLSAESLEVVHEIKIQLIGPASHISPCRKFFLDASRKGGGGYLQEAPDHIPSEPLLSESVYPLYGPVQPDIVAHGLLFQMHRYWKSPVLDERGHLRRSTAGIRHHARQ